MQPNHHNYYFNTLFSFVAVLEQKRSLNLWVCTSLTETGEFVAMRDLWKGWSIFKRSPSKLYLLGLIWKHHFVSKNCMATLGKLGYFLLQHLITLNVGRVMLVFLWWLPTRLPVGLATFSRIGQNKHSCKYGL